MPKYFMVYWVATVGESIVRAENEEQAIEIAKSGETDERIVSQNFWWHDAEACPNEAQEMGHYELKAMGIL